MEFDINCLQDYIQSLADTGLCDGFHMWSKVLYVWCVFHFYCCFVPLVKYNFPDCILKKQFVSTTAFILKNIALQVSYDDDEALLTLFYFTTIVLSPSGALLFLSKVLKYCGSAARKRNNSSTKLIFTATTLRRPRNSRLGYSFWLCSHCFCKRNLVVQTTDVVVC